MIAQPNSPRKPKVDPEAMQWKLHGACVAAVREGRADFDTFFAEHGKDDDYVSRTRTAKWICGQCPVVDPCLADALATKDVYGVRAGLTGNQRYNLLQERQTREVA